MSSQPALPASNVSNTFGITHVSAWQHVIGLAEHVSPRFSQWLACLSCGVQAWRMRALHFHLVQLVGLHGGGPAPSLAVARARSIPRHLVSRAMRLTKVSEAPAATAATDAGYAPDEIVLSPMVALMSAPVCVIMQLLGAAPTCYAGAGRDPCQPPVAT